MKTSINKSAIIIILLSIFVYSGRVNAQSGENKNRFGLKAGVNISGLLDDNVDDRDPIAGFNGGAFLKVAFSDHIAFQPEVLYSMKGGKLNYDEGALKGSATFRFNYIDVPLLAVINLTPNFNIHGGVFISSLLAAKIKNDANFNGLDSDKDYDKDDFETLDYGLAGGIGIDLDRVSIGARYEYGLNTIGKDQSFLGQSYQFPDARNSTVQVYVSISLF